jgi:predicted RNA-binding Zn ribbon-like protein
VVFAHDTEAALIATAALVNTQATAAPSRRDELTTTEQVEAFLDEHGFTGRRDGDRAELEALRALRPELRRLWDTEDDDTARLINAMLREGHAMPQLVRHDHWDWHVHATELSAPLATRLQVEAAMAFIDVIRTGERRRLRSCGADDCEAVLVDLSRNRSKRYCDVGNCGNRMHVTAYRLRRTSTPPD